MFSALKLAGKAKQQEQPNTPYRAHMSLENTHKPIRIYMEGLILGANTLYKLFCFFKLFAAIGKGINQFRYMWYCTM